MIARQKRDAAVEIFAAEIELGSISRKGSRPSTIIFGANKG
jgi:hypothetical protein